MALAPTFLLTPAVHSWPLLCNTSDSALNVSYVWGGPSCSFHLSGLFLPLYHINTKQQNWRQCAEQMQGCLLPKPTFLQLGCTHRNWWEISLKWTPGKSRRQWSSAVCCCRRWAKQRVLAGSKSDKIDWQQIQKENRVEGIFFYPTPSDAGYIYHDLSNSLWACMSAERGTKGEAGPQSGKQELR